MNHLRSGMHIQDHPRSSKLEQFRPKGHVLGLILMWQSSVFVGTKWNYRRRQVQLAKLVNKTPGTVGFLTFMIAVFNPWGYLQIIQVIGPWRTWTPPHN